MEPTDPTRIAVKEHYARLASQKPRQSCCSDGDCCNSSKNVVEEGVLSLGCGTPLEAAMLKPGETVLDLGSGAGPDCIRAARLVGPSGRVIGLDMTSEMIAKARANTDRLGIENVEYRRGFLENMPVEDASIDVVISNCVVNLSPDKPAVFSEVLRVLKPGGRLVFSDIVVKGRLPQQVLQDQEAWCECVSGALDAEVYIDQLSSAGFGGAALQVNDNFSNLTEVPLNQPFSALISAVKPV